MQKKPDACQECRYKSDPDAIACSGCGHFITPETIELRKRHHKKISMLTLGYFMVFFIPFCLFLIFNGVKGSDPSGGGNSGEMALGVGLPVIVLAAIGYVVYLLFVKKK